MLLSWGAFSQIIAPFTETFSSGIPSAWSQSLTTGSPWVSPGTTGTRGTAIVDHTDGTGREYIWMDFSGGTDRDVIIQTDTIDVSSLTNSELKFYYNCVVDGALNPLNVLFIEVYNGTSWVIIDSIRQDNAGIWSEHFYNITPHVFSNKIVVRFRGDEGGSSAIGGGTGSGFNQDHILDDISVLELVPCRPVVNINSRNIGSSTATVGWTTATGFDTAWRVEYGPTGFTPGIGTGTTVQVSVDSANLTGLNPRTIYDYYITALCSTGDTALIAGPNNFITACLSGLSGTYTIDPANPTLGTNFNSFGDFFATVLNCGLDAATIVNVAAGSGPYILGADVPFIPGSSATNTLTMNGNGNTINKGSGTYFLALDGVKHLTINDFNFVNETPNTAMYGIMLRNSCDSITIKNNIFDMGTGYTTALAACIAASSSLTSPTSNGDNANNLIIDSNVFRGSYSGVTLRGSSTIAGSRSTGHVITNNSFEDQSTYGVYAYASDNILIDNNEFTRSTRTNSSAYYGVYNWYSTNSITTKNKVHDVQSVSTCYPLYLGYLTNSAASPGIIANNAIYDISNTSTFYGIYLYSFTTAASGGNDYLNIWHNTVTKNTTGTSSTTRGISVSSTIATYIDNVNLTNNIVSLTGSGTGTNHAVYFPTVATFSGSNNVFYNGPAGVNNLAFFGTDQATLADWNLASGQTANSDLNPIIIAPGFVPFSTSIDNFGTPLAGVTTDIDGVTRSLTTPDVGAIEFVPSGGDLAILSAGLSQVDACYGTSDTAFVNLRNLFGSTVDFSVNPVTIYINVTGPVNTTDSIVLTSDSLPVSTTKKYFLNNIDMSLPGKYSLTTYINFASNNILDVNDTIIEIDNSEVKPILLVTPTFDTLYSFTDSAKLSTQSPFYPGGAFFFTEVSHFKTTTGAPASWPAYLVADDYLEITGVPNSDLAGYTLEQWGTSSMNGSVTFPSGTVMSPNGTAIIMLGQSGSASEPSNFYYDGRGGATLAYSSSTQAGRILKDANGNIVDAHGYNGYNFPASANVSPADWSAPLSGGGGTSGQRLLGPDVNSGTNWVVSSSTDRQDPNAVNPGVTIPAPSSVPGLTWTDLTTMTVIDTTPEIYAQGFTANGTYPIEASFITPCGVYKDTAYITVLNQTYDTTIINSCDSFIMPLTNRVQYATGFYLDTLASTNAPVYDSVFFVFDVNIDTTNETITLVECDSFVSPSGKVWNISGTYLDTIINSLGCDSLMVFNLTVNYASAGMITTTVCDTFIAPSGMVFRNTGMYMDTIMNSVGCDSVITINLTILRSTTSSRSVTVCDTYMSPAGNTYITTGIYNDTLTNSIGCDSVIVINLTVNYSVSRTDNIALCIGTPHRVGPSLYTTAGTYTNVFLTNKGCDSTIITNLTYFAPAVATVNYNFCIGDSLQILGNWYYAATTFNDTVIGGSSNGCDSVTTHVITTRTTTPALDLGDDVASCLDGGVTIFASNAYDTYNWSNGGTTNILNVTGAASGAGSTDYILTVTQASSGCTARDTVNITFQSCVGINETEVDLNVSLYPNPASNFVTIDIFDKNNTGNLKLEITNSIGQVVTSQVIANANQKVVMDVNNFSKGLYFVRISSDKVFMTKKLIIQK